MMQPLLRELSDGHPPAPFDTEIILPNQFWAGPSDTRSDPEKRLMGAILEEAIATVLNPTLTVSGRYRELLQETDRWIDSDERLGLFTFASICDVLGLEAGQVRHVIVRLRQRSHTAYRRRRLQAGRGRHRVQRASRHPQHAA